MRQEHETIKSFNELKAITQAIMLKKGAQKNATHQESERTQASHNTSTESERTQKTGLKPKARTQTKKGRLNPTKKAFSERQRTTIRDRSQANANASLKTEQGNNSSLRADQSDEAQKQGLANNPSNQKGGEQ